MALGYAVTGETNGIVMNAAAKRSANMESKRAFAMFVAVLASVSTAKFDTSAKTAAASCIASTGNSGTGAGSAAGKAFANTERFGTLARIVEEAAFASMGGRNISAKSAVEVYFARTGSSGTGAGSAVAPPFAIMEKCAAVANCVAGLRFASMGGKEDNARIVEEAAFVLIRE